MNNIKAQKGSVSIIIIALIVIGLIAGGVYLSKQSKEPAENEEEGNIVMEKDANTMEHDDAIMEKEGGVMEEKESDAILKVSSETEGEKVSFSGRVLAGTNAPFLEFNKADYDKALATDKLVVLYFYANWCPICKAEIPKAEAAFKSIQSNNVVGFRVNFNDNETDDNEKQLAREFGVPYQHTKVFVKNGKRVLKSPEEWETSTYLSKINEFSS
ncbi:MAG: hypothetical protein COU08_01600 [Candidatus Harrisonbacteria bacterium CG10_big_fil_rev_8_21_14_0_10_42_17]|uniref:Thioredoxin domain-containing protein n=1 Tax=Candidatus Harrisonbacteria bacterium CG10_big_fil_rev_8_21_14_0_10_42_17 TaxID=1974584 RepID=A0A2M6WIP5_9BACT|nr:MAG: hypothetical protein COU08_01600 [Candidatus Harrisonbacteria bacterium CG10_big_fil_rev_8_21_14_0_10_42_17]